MPKSKTNLQELSDLPNLGPKSAQILSDASIDSVNKLYMYGSIECYLRVKEHTGGNTSLNLLYAIEGAIRGEHWQTIAREDKLRLLMELEDREKVVSNN